MLWIFQQKSPYFRVMATYFNGCNSWGQIKVRNMHCPYPVCNLFAKLCATISTYLGMVASWLGYLELSSNARADRRWLPVLSFKDPLNFCASMTCFKPKKVSFFSEFKDAFEVVYWSIVRSYCASYNFQSPSVTAVLFSSLTLFEEVWGSLQKHEKRYEATNSLRYPLLFCFLYHLENNYKIMVSIAPGFHKITSQKSWYVAYYWSQCSSWRR